MNSYPHMPPLDTRQVKELLRQIRVLRGDYPHLSAEELAEEWAERQRWLAEADQACPYAQWIASDRWRNGFMSALRFADRQREQKQRAKASRTRHKEFRQDREPATPRQQRFVKRLAEKRGEALPAAPEALSKLAASRLIKRFLDES